MKRMKLALIALLAFALLFAVSCGNTCDTHVDANNDGKCDNCSTAVEKQPCAECTDINNDGICDTCGGTVEKEPCEECVDEDGDLICDVCGNDYVEVLTEVDLIKKGKANFNIVYQSGLPGAAVKAIDYLIKDLKDLGVTVTKVEDKANTAQECEVLIGNITSRGDKYKRDMHVYGAKGYAVELIGNKIIIVPGSNDAYTDAIEAFKESFLGITSSTKKLTNVTVTKENNATYVQDDYRVKQLTLFGNDIKNFTIAAEKTKKDEYNTAVALQELLYTKTGYWLEIVSHEEADKSIVINLADRTGGDGYQVTVEENRITFVCEYVTCIQDKVESFFSNKISRAGGTGVAEFDATDSAIANVRDVFYKDFGAKGDGRTDDAEAIRACHEYANKGGHVVNADNGATYYIGILKEEITIKTNVNWKNAVFYLDDMKVKPNSGYRGVSIFHVSAPGTLNIGGLSDWKAYVNENGGLDASKFTKIDLDFGQNAFVRIMNENHKNYIRYGVNENEGASQSEVLLVDKDGNVDPTTPLMFDYEEITGISARPIDLDPIVIEGGIFKTSPYYTNVAQAYTAYGRNISCSRSNVTFRNIKHQLVNEGSYNYNAHSGDYGCPYGGFYSVSLANNVVYENCVAAAHVTYKGSNGAGMGTYDISPGNSTNVVYRNCYQEDGNFFNTDAGGMSRWGVMGSSGCKNITFENSKLTRFDAHNGVHNVYLIDSTLRMIRIDGTGTFYMEGCTMYSNNFVGLREDYGGFWHGNIILKDNTIISEKSSVTLMSNTWYNHNFGYEAAFPTNIIIDNLKVFADDKGTPFTGTVTLFDNGILNAATKSVQDYFEYGKQYADGSPVMVANRNKIPAPERIIIRNTEIDIILPDTSDYTWFRNTIFSVNQDTECTRHIDINSDLKCDDCGGTFTPCTQHSDINKDGYCTYCNKDTNLACGDHHTDIDKDGRCDTCKEKFVCEGHEDADKNHLCDKCAAPHCGTEHFGKTGACMCDVCREKVFCKDENNDGKCDTCEAAMTEAAD